MQPCFQSSLISSENKARAVHLLNLNEVHYLITCKITLPNPGAEQEEKLFLWSSEAPEGEGIELCYVNSIFPHSHLEQRKNLKGFFLAWWQMKHGKLNAVGYHYSSYVFTPLYTVGTLLPGKTSVWHYIPEHAVPVPSLSLRISGGIHQTLHHTTSYTWVIRRATAFFRAFSLPSGAGGKKEGCLSTCFKIHCQWNYNKRCIGKLKMFELKQLFSSRARNVGKQPNLTGLF